MKTTCYANAVASAALLLLILLPSTTMMIQAQSCGGGDGGGMMDAAGPLGDLMGGMTTTDGGQPDLSSLPPPAIAAIVGMLQDLDLSSGSVQLGLLWDDIAIIAADLWDPEPKILSALPGFDGIIGVEQTREAALDAGATWVEDLEELCGVGATSPQTSAVPAALGNIYNCGGPIDHDDGFPICFSWPVVPSSIKREYLLYKRSDGVEFNPKCISTIPNFEYNERHCVVIFDDFINRNFPDEEDYIYMEELEIVGPIMLVGPDGLFDATGMTYTNPREASAYLSGPVFVGARLVPLHNEGESLPEDMMNAFGSGPNSGLDLYALEEEETAVDELYRLRLYYSGGMTPDGLTGLTPIMYDRYFSLIFSTGQELSTSNMDMVIDGTDTTVTVLGLADTGIYLEDEAGYNPCYADDRDNYIDIIMKVTGDPTVLETTLTSFNAFKQQPGLYNPGGPGPTPFDGIRYVAPAPEQTYPIDVDLNRIREVSYCVHQDGTESMDAVMCQQWLDSCEMMQVEQGQLFAEQVQQILAMITSMQGTDGGDGGGIGPGVGGGGVGPGVGSGVGDGDVGGVGGGDGLGGNDADVPPGGSSASLVVAIPASISVVSVLLLSWL